VRKLRNGSFAASRVTAGRASKRARISGLVTYSDQRSGKFVVSARGVSLVVNRRSPGRFRSAAADPLPSPGTLVTVSSSFNENGEVEADSVENDGQNNNYADLEGRVLSIDTVARTLTVTADDDDEIQGGTILVHLPATFNIATYSVGDVVRIVASANADGSYTAVGTSLDGGIDEADGDNNQQGNNEPGDNSNGQSANNE
jgi:hypothetical protein